jgi:hypothetical protein
MRQAWNRVFTAMDEESPARTAAAATASESAPPAPSEGLIDDARARRPGRARRKVGTSIDVAKQYVTLGEKLCDSRRLGGSACGPICFCKRILEVQDWGISGEFLSKLGFLSPKLGFLSPLHNAVLAPLLGRHALFIYGLGREEHSAEVEVNLLERFYLLLELRECLFRNICERYMCCRTPGVVKTPRCR